MEDVLWRLLRITILGMMIGIEVNIAAYFFHLSLLTTTMLIVVGVALADVLIELFRRH